MKYKQFKKAIKYYEMKIWSGIFVSAVLVCSILLVQVEAEYYDIHKENQLISKDIQKKEEIISELKVIENELSSPKRILKIAKEQGLEYHEDNLITLE